MSCCTAHTTAKTCKRLTDGKTFNLPRRFTRKQCENPRGFTMRSSCAPYAGCKKIGGGAIQAVSVLGNKDSEVNGTIVFTQTAKGVKVDYDINGLSDGKHGFHIHECGDLTDGCKSACAHFNPYNKQHGGLDSRERHAGDLGNVISKDGKAVGSLTSSVLSLRLRHRACIIGRMALVHKDEDDLGLGENPESLITGNAGERVACGVIGFKKMSA